MTIAQLLGVVEKLSFFESAILNYFSSKKNIFCFILIQISHNLWSTKDFSKFKNTLISSKKLGVYRNMKHTVYTKSAAAADFVYISESNESYEKHSTQMMNSV